MREVSTGTRGSRPGVLWRPHSEGMPRSERIRFQRPFHPRRPGLVAPVRCDPAGRDGPRWDAAQGRDWRRTSHGYYVPAYVDGGIPEQRIVEAAAVLPPISAVTGWAALRWLGATWFDGRSPDGGRQLPVTLAAIDIRAPANAVLSEEGLPPDQIVVVDGLPVVRPMWATAFEMRYAGSAREGAVTFAMAAYADLVSIEEYDLLVPQLTGRTGIPRMREARPLLTENAWSPWEVRMANIWVLEAELDPPLFNQPVFDAETGRHIGTPDLLDVESGLVGQYDGAVHAAGAQRRSDRDRDEVYRYYGLETVVMMQGDAANRAVMAERILRARERARAGQSRVRRWTVQPPPWWTPTQTVAQRRALSKVQRERLLRHRRAA